jgi:two-component system, chemotaxis family, chemotaxis protein CheY
MTTMNVVIVDDSAAIRKILRRVLLQTEIAIGEIHEAGDGQDAVRILKDNPVNLILSDINMPNMDGIELLRTIKNNSEWAHLPVLMITTEGGQAKVMEALQLGAAGYVRKPFTADQLKEKIIGVVGTTTGQG